MDPIISLTTNPTQREYVAFSGSLPYPGKFKADGFAFTGFERNYWLCRPDDAQSVYLRLNEFDSFVFTNGQIKMLDKNAHSLSMVLPSLANDITLTLPSASGEVALKHSYSALYGNGTDTTYTVAHNLNSQTLLVQAVVSGTLNNQMSYTIVDINTITVTISQSPAPAANQVRINIQAI